MWESTKRMNICVFKYFVWETINFIRTWGPQDKKLNKSQDVQQISNASKHEVDTKLAPLTARSPQAPGGKHGPVWEKYENETRNVWDMCHDCEVASRGFQSSTKSRKYRKRTSHRKNWNVGRLLIQSSLNMRNVWDMYEKHMRRLSDDRAGWAVTIEKHRKTMK